MAQDVAFEITNDGILFGDGDVLPLDNSIASLLMHVDILWPGEVPAKLRIIAQSSQYCTCWRCSGLERDPYEEESCQKDNS